ncbi:hypothetical protein C453_03489 [Haloferax elongans ATCC BAA-1513]|uniref:Uncharacterized protein n=1 Tax=Haloferax elongans ATCC BAA-1513 TaxID=1230453 RepID=M0HUM7_HALEO|nr:hypothetical protein [Haloferax elongans]ELZ87382.1 hypothetical protein C453_03489 [Haloferax elongans ATCC BAA-1513]
MDLALLVPPLMFIAAGGYMYRQPMSVRNVVPPKEWKESPEKAEQLQRVLAKAVGAALALGGVLWLVVGLAF